MKLKFIPTQANVFHNSKAQGRQAHNFAVLFRQIKELAGHKQKHFAVLLKLCFTITIIIFCQINTTSPFYIYLYNMQTCFWYSKVEEYFIAFSARERERKREILRYYLILFLFEMMNPFNYKFSCYCCWRFQRILNRILISSI